jgi:outer membrane protein assembly factor BamB
MRSSRLWLTAGVLLVLAACSKDKEIDKPSPLPTFNATIRAEKVWSADVADKGGKLLRLGLGLAVDGNRVYAAGHKGEVAAFDLANGRSIWRTKTKSPLAGGPGVGGGLVVVGSTYGDLIAVNASDGAVRWKVRVNGEVLSAPAVSEKLVAVRTVDGKLRGLSPKDGHELWTQEQQVPRLSLRGTAWPVVVGDLVLCGYDNGKVSAINSNDGSVQWETTIAPPHGKTELERLDDVDASVRVSGSDVYAIGFQGRIAMLALDTGQIWWSHDASSFRGLGLDDTSLYISTADGEIIALRRRTGTELWRQKSLLHRRLSAAVETDNAVVTGDYQGYVHWFDKATGAIAARASTGKVRISNAPVVAGKMVLVINDAGRIVAFRATSVGGAKPVAVTPDEAATTPAATPGGSSADTAVKGESTDTNAGAAGDQSAAGSDAGAIAPKAEPPATLPPPAGSTSGSVPQPAPQSAPEPAPAPESKPPLPSGTPPAPPPTQTTPDPLPPRPQTQPQPPPS